MKKWVPLEKVIDLLYRLISSLWTFASDYILWMCPLSTWMFYGSSASQEQSEFCGWKVGKKTCILLGLRFMDKYRGYVCYWEPLYTFCFVPRKGTEWCHSGFLIFLCFEWISQDFLGSDVPKKQVPLSDEKTRWKESWKQILQLCSLSYNHYPDLLPGRDLSSESFGFLDQMYPVTSVAHWNAIKLENKQENSYFSSQHQVLLYKHTSGKTFLLSWKDNIA